jgi:hypothetical protein
MERQAFGWLIAPLVLRFVGEEAGFSTALRFGRNDKLMGTETREARHLPGLFLLRIQTA